MKQSKTESTASKLPPSILDKPMPLKIYEQETEAAPDQSEESRVKNLRDKYNMKLLKQLEVRAHDGLVWVGRCVR